MEWEELQEETKVGEKNGKEGKKKHRDEGERKRQIVEGKEINK